MTAATAALAKGRWRTREAKRPNICGAKVEGESAKRKEKKKTQRRSWPGEQHGTQKPGLMLPLRYSLRYGGRAEVCLRDALDAQGWVETEEWEDSPLAEGGAAAAAPHLLYLPYTRTPWDFVLDSPSRCLCACYPIRTALVRKDELALLLSQADASTSPAACLVRQGAPRSELLAALAGLPGPPWMLKSPALNNALGLRLCSSADALWEACGELFAAMPQGAATAPLPLVVQQYIGAHPARPLLLHQGRFKFHVRVNALAVGACAVYVHEAMVCHVACQEFSLDEPMAPFAHITNHVLQRKHPHYRREAHTLLLPALLAEAGVDARATQGAIRAAVAGVFRLALQGKRLAFEPLAAEGKEEGAGAPLPPLKPAREGGQHPGRHSFLPAANCFELFGFDMLLLREAGGALSPVILEVNAGPALEGLALPALCAKVCSDTAQLVLGHLPAASRLEWATPPIPEGGNGWQRVL